MDQKMQFIADYLRGELSMTELWASGRWGYRTCWID
jgi:hypothetical protein